MHNRFHAFLFAITLPVCTRETPLWMTRNVLTSIKRKVRDGKKGDGVRTTLPTYNIGNKLTRQSSVKLAKQAFKRDRNKY